MFSTYTKWNPYFDDVFEDVFKDEASRKKAVDSWNGLKTRINWNKWNVNHSEYMREVKKLCRGTAHPDFEIEAVEKIVKSGNINKVTEKKQACLELIEIYKKLIKEKLQSSQM